MKPTSDHDDLVEKLDTLVGPAAEPENAVLQDRAPVVRWTGCDASGPRARGEQARWPLPAARGQS